MKFKCQSSVLMSGGKYNSAENSLETREELVGLEKEEGEQKRNTT